MGHASDETSGRAVPRWIGGGRYALHERISSGGMASVHLGRQIGAIGFSRAVAIKRLHAELAVNPELAAMLLDEARLASRIHHPNVVGTRDVVSEDGEIFLVMDYVSGESLANALRAASAAGEGPSAAVAVAVVIDVLHGLHAAHEARSARGEPLLIVHRDVSPNNVLVGQDGVARLIDFGIAKARERVHVTRGGDLRGTLRYMAPEQMLRARVDRRADVYAASVMLWELLARRSLVAGDNEGAIARAVVEEAAAPPSAHARGVCRALDEAVLKGLAKEPSARFATALEMAAALEAALTPASKRDVGAWLSRTVAGPLREREAAVRKMEEREDDSCAPAGPALATTTASEPALALATTSAPPRADVARPARRTALTAALACVLVACGAGLAWRARGTPLAASPMRAGELAAVAPARAAEPVPVEAASPPEPPPSATEVRAAAPRPAPQAGPKPRNAAAQVESASPSKSPTRRAACRDPFKIDRGIKVPKLECL